ncbi:MAG: hypothetical protein A2653_01210 [Candidatus Zambryskibacteria bacterium RIFCSPHIGHO2_01_FULL_43_25]|uniref:DUF192 domain-containing protein n=1 Tax=Candidatus Zambryskibacteria bacterium RIFCSPLOWO2_01_FULL_45_21 TaxID=1802761 RepID=A0A1G2U5K0_9BACT|nr:MAG: hypothetical protein A2653_01210 [Candidatus Zambryskibacteria bacterium RIFCSPHIGHO2_01_FULL_43_25]OHB00424.1 MAG: hypothetical protein A3E94_01830 [Candidatus Zambryskibacteria bacterium RIFCSPHIGHO2_12_FULL_44_12b]OHB04220.1 MAG: hypothetical protein A3B14_02305 [Candidatus Zambryskibacteria bacterium RIFCSPLOWO2_01_FULL_45_21]
MNNSRQLIVIGIIFLIAVILFGFFALKHDGRDVGNNSLEFTDRIQVGDDFINVAIADSPEEQAKGLSDQLPIESHQGLLITFQSSGIYSIWMKDMKFALDAIWIDKNGEVVDIKTNLTPETYPAVFTPRVPALYILEIPAGSVENFGIKIGDKVVF